MKLWAITCLFNPAGFRTRTDNYRIFRKQFRLPLLTVELAFEDEFELAEGDAEILIQRRGGARLWQKERLLNIALEHLPDDCDAVVAVDADVLIADPGWGDKICGLLERYPVAQPFARVHHLDANRRRISSRASTIGAWSPGGVLILPDPPYAGGTGHSNGHAWAARREVVARNGFYDGSIIGGGDTAFLGAVAGRLEMTMAYHRMTPRQWQHYAEWGEPLLTEVAGQVGVLDTEIEHLWHGTTANRRWRHRHDGLARVGFDPHRDVRINEQGVWQWASERPELHAFLENYFKDRQEDELPAAAAR